MLIACQAYCQIDTKKDSVKLPFQVAYKINLDLLDYDRLIKNKVEQNLKKCLLISREKDSVIKTINTRVELVKKQLELTEEQNTILKEQLQFSTKKKKGGWIWGFVGLAVGATTVAILN